MKRLVYLTIILLIAGCESKNCREWYSRVILTPVSSVNNGSERIGDYYTTDYFDNEINLHATLISSADGYEECKSKTRIHEVVTDSIILRCGNDMVIGEDTLKAFSNLIQYFSISLRKGNILFNYNSMDYSFPEFESVETTFHIELKLSDSKVLKDSCLVRIGTK